MNDLVIRGSPVECPLCRRWVPTFNTHDDERLRYTGHNAASGYRAGRECDNSGELCATRAPPVRHPCATLALRNTEEH